MTTLGGDQLTGRTDTFATMVRKAGIYTGEAVTRQHGRNCLTCLHNNEPYYCPHVHCQPVSRLAEDITVLALEAAEWIMVPDATAAEIRERLQAARTRLAELSKSVTNQLEYVRGADRVAAELLDYLTEDAPR